jgi:hypothetical protein
MYPYYKINIEKINLPIETKLLPSIAKNSENSNPERFIWDRCMNTNTFSITNCILSASLVQSRGLEKDITKIEPLYILIETAVLLRLPMNVLIFLNTLIKILSLSGLILFPLEYFLIFNG